MRIITIYCFSTLLLFSFILPASSQPDARMASVFEYLTREDEAKIHLELDLDALLNNRRKPDYLPAALTGPDGQVYKLEVRTRGKYRRRSCEIPPVKFKFQKTELQSHQLDTFNEIKLVLPCTATPAGEELIVWEYLAYRMFESLSHFSARARLIRLELKNNKKKRPQKMLAMLVEHEEEIAARLQAAPVQEWGIAQDRFHAEQVALMVLFQYMIGNTDWDLEACRNVLVLQPEDKGKMVAVPFDFDFSGLVSAPYATPNSTSGLTHVKDRFLMANGMDQEALLKAKETILTAKSTLMKCCENRQLSVEASLELTQFLDQFFSLLAQSPDIPNRMERVKK